MKRIWTRIMALLLAVVLLAGMLPPATAKPVRDDYPMVTASQGQPVRIANVAEDFAWTLENGVLTISGHGDMPNWTSNDNPPWYSQRSAITSVVIDEGITSVGDMAFYGCPVASVKFPEKGITYFGSDVFVGCTMTSLEIPEGVVEIDTYAFSGTSLRKVKFPESVTRLSYGIFMSSRIEEVELPKGLLAIDPMAFYTCRRLKSINIPDSVAEIGEYAFCENTGLESIHLPANLTAIFNDTFYGCTALTSIDIPDSVIQIGDYAFLECSRLETVELPDSLTTLGVQAFADCIALKSVDIPDDLNAINTAAFAGCRALESVTFSSALRGIAKQAFTGCSSLTDVDLPYDLRYIGASAFSGCTALRRAVLRENVASVEMNSFSGCNQLTIYGYAGSYAEEYAADCGIPFEALDADGARTVTLRLMDDTGSSVESGYRVEWYADGILIGNGRTLKTQDTESAYSCRVVLDEELLTVFYPPEEITFTVGEDDVELECVLKRIPTVTLTGRMLDEDGTPLSGTIQITQCFQDALVQTETFTTRADGTFSVEAAAVHTTLLFQAEDFRDRSLPLMLTGQSGIYALGDVPMSRIPAARVTLELRRLDAVRPGETAEQTALTDLDGWHFTVTNVTRNADITDFVIQYPYLIPGAGLAAAGDVLRIGAEHPGAGIICEPVEVPLSDLVSGRCKLTFRQPGSFELKEIIGRVQSRLLVFGEDGVLVAADLTCEGYRSADLRSGSYQVVLMEPTELLVSVPELSVLDRYGLTAGQDYAKLDVTVTNGVISVIEQVQIPELDESKLFYTVPETTGMRLNPSATFVDRCVMMRVEYELPEDIGASNETVYIHLPEGLQVMDNSLTVDNEPVSFIATDGTIRVPVNREKAVIHMYLQGGEVGTYAVDAELEFEKDGTVITQPLGSAELKLDVVFFRLPEQTSFSDLIISGTALPDTTVTVYDGDEPVGTAVANGAGTWKAEVKLDNPYNYMPHSISVGVSGGALEKEIRTEPELLIYDGAIAEAVRVTMYNGAHETVFDFRDPTTDPYYTYQSRDYSFVVELNQPDDSRIEQVYVVTINGQGRTVYVECVYDPARNVWLGTHQYFGATDAPLGLDVEVIMKEYEGPILDEKLIEDVEQLVAEFEEEYDRQEEEYWKTLEETLVHPDFGKMTIDEVIIYVEGIQEETETLLNEIEEGQYKGLEAEGITVEEDDRGIRYSNDSASVRYRTEPLEKVDGAELEKEGYTAYKLTKNRTVYFRTYKNTIEYLDGEGKQKIICELDEILEGNDSLETISDIKDTLSLINDVKKHQDKSGIDWTKFYKYHRDKARTNGIRAQVALQDLDEKIFNLEWENGDPDLIRKYKGQYDDLKFKEGLYELDADLYGSKFRYYSAMDKFGKACDFLDLALDIKDIGDTVHKGEVLQTVYKSLGRVCVGNEEYEIMEREIKVLNTSMNVSSASYAGASAAATAGTLFNVPIGVGVQVGVFAVKKLADYTHNKEYKRIGTRLKTLDCDGDGVPDYIEELMELGLMKNVIIDPSGYVYEAVPSNRLEGVKAEIYYRDGDQHVLWDAANFDQVNPGYTDTEGRYHWDVPMGEWLVKYSKEGYLDTDSSGDPAANEDGYLPVPPPQMEVNVGMVSTVAPLVESMNVYQDQIQVIFSQYMKPGTVKLTVSCGGKTVSGKLMPANAEYNEERTEQFATIFNFVPDTQLRGNATVTIAEAVNYAGTEMTEAFVRTEAVQLRPAGLSMDKETGILYGEAAELTVQILPAEAGANKTLTVTTSAPGIVDVQEQTVTTDGDGRAVIMVYGSLPGTAEVTVGLGGTDLKTTGRIRVELTKVTACAKVTASIPNGSVVEAGTELELFTATAGAEIYYTLDGTCPCVVDSLSRIRYTGPIVLTEDTFLIAYAVKNGLEDSATTGFMYTMKPKPVNPFRDVPEGAWYYEPVMWALEKGITEGISETEFGSSQNCNRAQAVTFLWSAAGKPEPTATSHPFVDVPKGSFCEKAVLWAVEEGITSGTDATHFSPLATCNRATIVTFLYHAFEDPDVSIAENPFSDVPDASWYTAPVLWAVEMGITAGTDATHFTPGATCMRAHMITFLYSAYNK